MRTMTPQFYNAVKDQESEPETAIVTWFGFPKRVGAARIQVLEKKLIPGRRRLEAYTAELRDLELAAFDCVVAGARVVGKPSFAGQALHYRLREPGAALGLAVARDALRAGGRDDAAAAARLGRPRPAAPRGRARQGERTARQDGGRAIRGNPPGRTRCQSGSR